MDKVMMPKKCCVCQKMFFPANFRAKYCSDACKQKGAHEVAKANEKRKREERKSRVSNVDKIIEIQKLAAAAGMSYGQYVNTHRV